MSEQTREPMVNGPDRSAVGQTPEPSRKNTRIVSSSSRTSGGQPTLATMTAAAEISPATVSRVINDSAPVTAAIREAVETAIARLGYVPNRAARSLVTQRTNSIALVVREPVGFGIA